MKKILLSILSIALVSIVAIGATRAYFSDTETSMGNMFSAGTLDLEVDGENDPLGMKFSGDLMVPGSEVNAGTITLENVGTIDGILTVMVSNPVSHENGTLEPELADGDIAGQEIDPTGYDANTGNGELWDQCKMKIYFDMNSDGVMQWNEPLIYSGPMGLDMTSFYSISLDTNLWVANHGFDGILSPGETVDLGLYVTFMDDQGSPFTSQPQYNGLTNNMAMSDDMQFDLIFGLEQVGP